MDLAILMDAVAIRNRSFDDLPDSVRAEKFKPDGVQHRSSARLDHVMGDTYGGPGPFIIGPFDQYSNLGRSTFVAVQDADFVIAESNFVETRIMSRQAFAQRVVQRIEGTLARAGCRAEMALVVHDDAGHSFGLALSVCFSGNIEAH